MPAPLPSGPSWVRWVALAGVSLVVVGMLAFISGTVGATLEWYRDPADANLNLLVRGFRDGHVSLSLPAPEGLRHLAFPYDPEANAVYRHYPYNLHDMSYYQGKLYLYYGPVASLLLLWPWVALTGRFLWQSQAAVIFGAAGYAAALGWLLACRRRYFPGLSTGVLAACALALGLATGLPVMLQRPGVCEVPIACAYALVMLSLGAIWRTLHGGEHRRSWMAAASLAYGLAVASRPSVLFGAVILLVPVVQSWWQDIHSPLRARGDGLFLSAVGPIAAVGAGLMAYNWQRFDSPIEFGQHLQMASFRLGLAPTFSLNYLWFNFRVYFLEPVRLMAHFPFTQGIAAPPIPAGHTSIESPYGVLTNVPFTLLALAAPLAVRGRQDRDRTPFRWFLVAAGLAFGVCALTLCLYWGACERYEVEFLPALVLLAVCGVLGLEEALATRRRSLLATRAGWLLLLAWSVAFNVVAPWENAAAQYFARAEYCAADGRPREAIADYSRVLRIAPVAAVALRRAWALSQAGEHAAAAAEFEQYLRTVPNNGDAENGLAVALAESGRKPEALAHAERAVRLAPADPNIRYNFGLLLEDAGRLPEAALQYSEALRLRPDFAAATERLRIARGGR